MIVTFLQSEHCLGSSFLFPIPVISNTDLIEHEVDRSDHEYFVWWLIHRTYFEYSLIYKLRNVVLTNYKICWIIYLKFYTRLQNVRNMFLFQNQVLLININQVHFTFILYKQSSKIIHSIELISGVTLTAHP